MAGATALVEATAHSIAFTFTEDGNAVDTIQVDIPAILVAGPLNDLLNPAAAVANQAAARVLIDQNCDITIYPRTSVPNGATAGAQVLCDPNINGGAAGNFALDMTGVKAANADVALFQCRIALRHSFND